MNISRYLACALLLFTSTVPAVSFAEITFKKLKMVQNEEGVESGSVVLANRKGDQFGAVVFVPCAKCPPTQMDTSADIQYFVGRDSVSAEEAYSKSGSPGSVYYLKKSKTVTRVRFFRFGVK